MAVMLGAAALLLAMVAVAVMGYAIQHGATCMVAAVTELVRHSRASQLGALLEAALWVTGGIIVARAVGLSMATPLDHPLSWGVIAGGALLGLGAFTAGACAFGAVARLGSGEWAHIATPLGYFAGCLLAARLGVLDPPPPLETLAPLVAAPAWLAVPVLIFAALRIRWLVKSGGWRDAGSQGAPWHPHAATIVISLAFVFLLFLAGPWAYTDAIVGFAHGRADGLLPQLLLLASLIAGAAFGAHRAGRWISRRPRPVPLLRCFAGGVLMALGSLMIPGSNDSLILIGLPNLQAYAWTAMAAMVASITLALIVQKRLREGA